MKFFYYLLYFNLFIATSCSTSSETNNTEIKDVTEAKDDTTTETDEMDNEETDTPDSENDSAVKIISLGDSYTIGESVCERCRFPEQLKDSILKKHENISVDLKVIAETGWTTNNLINAIDKETLANNYDIATLLIGVNNQFQGVDFDVFTKEFSKLVNIATELSKGESKNVIVVSIPDYAYTPFGNANVVITQEIDKYNNFIRSYCNSKEITYIYITDITRKGLEQPNLVAKDNLHPSTLAYSKFVELILPHALEKIEND